MPLKNIGKKEARLQEHDAGGSSQGQGEGVSRQNEGSSQQHNEPETGDWQIVQKRKSNRSKSYSTRESSPLLPDADNTLHHFRNPPRPLQPTSVHLHKKQGQKPTTQSEVDTEDQQRISEIKELVKASEPGG